MSKRLFKPFLSAMLVIAMLFSVCIAPLGSVLATDYVSFFEAEDVAAVDGATWTVVDDADASGGKVASETKNQEFILENVAEANKVTFKFASTTTRVAKVYILEGDTYRELGEIGFVTTTTTAMSRGRESSLVGVYIPAGSTLKIVPTEETNIDYFKVDSLPLNDEASLDKNIRLAKYASLTGSATVETNVMSTVGKAVTLSSAGDSVTFSMPTELNLAELNAASIKYYSESGAEVEYSVNGVPVESSSLKSCKDSAYNVAPALTDTVFDADTTVTVTLKSGTVSVDYLEFIDKLDPTESREIIMPSGNNDRTETSLDGVWLATKTDAVKPAVDVTVPNDFEYTAPVPGLWDMATPSLSEMDSNNLWYKTSITMPADYTADSGYIVELKINRAVYGRTVFVNGKFAGHYAYNHTISYTDISSLLTAGENTVAVMLGEKLSYYFDDSIKPAYGNDSERSKFLMGITDSVSVVVNKAPQVDSVQVAPDIEAGTVAVKAMLSNTTGADIISDVTFKVYELGVYENGVAPMKNLVGVYTEKNVSVGANGATVKLDSIRLANYSKADKTWWPESPFLYQIEVVTSGDTLAKRFGMKEFTFDPETKDPMLNGETYRLLGTNVVLGRFYEDSNHEDYAWQEDWVKQLYTTFKDTNWDVYRSHIGPVPEMWYDLADEMGMMIVDEYGWWYDDGTSPEVAANEVFTTIDQRQTHPSIIYWDAQNETGSWPHSTQMLQIVGTDYDIAERCWDNGMNPPLDENQPTEYHPYPWGGIRDKAEIAKLNNMTDQYPSNGGNNDSTVLPNPIIINEYAELWLNREGDPTNCTIDNYENMMPNATAEERQAWYGQFIATLTEFWRSGKNIAGIQYFAGLTFSKPTDLAPTSDLLMPDISNPTVWPHIQELVKDSFAKLGICLDLYDATTKPGLDFDYPVRLYNDLNRDIENLAVIFKAVCNGRVLAEETQYYNIAAAGDANGGDFVTKTFSFVTPTNLSNGDEIFITAEYTLDGETVTSRRSLICEGFSDGSDTEVDYIASIGKTAEASSSNAVWWAAPKRAVDGDAGSRWLSEDGDTEAYFTVDLGIKKDITRVKINWFSTTAYKLLISDDNINWIKVGEDTVCDSGYDEFIMPKGTSARYVKAQCTATGNNLNNSIIEFEVYSPKVKTLLYSQGKSVESSPIYAWWGAAGYVTDGDSTTRWHAENGVHDAWITVDLGKTKEINHIELAWAPNCYGKEYLILVSDDNTTWTEAYHHYNGTGSTHSIDLPKGITGRYVKMQGIEYGGSNYQMYAMDIYVPVDEQNIALEGVRLSKDKLTVNMAVSNTEQLYAYANPINANDIKSFEWLSDNAAVATVSDDGIVKAHSAGTANITYTIVSDAGVVYTASCEITAKNEGTSIESSVLLISNKQVKVNIGTTVAELKACFDGEDLLEIKTALGTAVSAGDKVTTGMTVNKIIGGEAVDSITVVIKGDLSKDGEVSSLDALMIRQLMLSVVDADAASVSAGDLDANGKITAADYIGIKLSALEF